MDFAASRQANELYASFVSQVAMAGISSNIPHYPAGVAESMIKNDFAWASENRAHSRGVGTAVRRKGSEEELMASPSYSRLPRKLSDGCSAEPRFDS